MQNTKQSTFTLALGALGVVFGDIGTSPLYAFKEIFNPSHGLTLTNANILGALSVITWSLFLVVLIKYCFFILRADNHGEGGTMALLALLSDKLKQTPKLKQFVIYLAIFATALFYGDGSITPAISVLSAVEGLALATPIFSNYTVFIACLIIIALFSFQFKGTHSVGKIFAPFMFIWFTLLAGLGIYQIIQMPEILSALMPTYAFTFFIDHPAISFVTLGAAVLVLTGAEAMYADLGHFGRKPIVLAWSLFVFPSLLLNYFGQGALLLHSPQASSNPFYLMAPSAMLYPMIFLSTCATIIASQALISGAYSITKQAIQLGFLPRMNIKYTSSLIGQIYIAKVNWILMISVLLLIIFFKTSSNLAVAYGLAVTGTMFISTLLATLFLRLILNYSYFKTSCFFILFFILDALFVSSNLLKIKDGGWLPLCIGVFFLVIMTTWRTGKQLIAKQLANTDTIEDFFQAQNLHTSEYIFRPPHTAVFLTSYNTLPPAFLHNLKHNNVFHKTTIFLTLEILKKPYVSDDDRISIKSLNNGCYRVYLYFGFRERINVPKYLKRGFAKRMFELHEPISYFLNRESVIASPQTGMLSIRDHLFIILNKSAADPAKYFQLPTNQVIELGTQVNV